MRQAFREQFVLHRTETEETMSAPGKGTVGLALMQPMPAQPRRGKLPGPHLRTKQSPLSWQQDCLAPGYMFCYYSNSLVTL